MQTIFPIIFCVIISSLINISKIFLQKIELKVLNRGYIFDK
jgi:hypothetical protein